MIDKLPLVPFVIINLTRLTAGVTKHGKGTLRNGIYRNKPEYAGMRRNNTGMKPNEPEWHRNIPKRARMTPK